MDQFRSCGYAQYSSTNAAFTLSTNPDSGVPLPNAAPADGSNQQPRGVLLQAETANMRWTDDGATTPTSTKGFLLLAGSDPFLYTGDLTRLKFIQAAGGAIMNVGYYF